MSSVFVAAITAAIIGSAAVVIARRSDKTEVVRVDSAVDGKSYLVLNLPDKKVAADRLATINQHCETVIRHLVQHHAKKDSVQRLKQKYDGSALSEGSPNNGYATSYSVNKGEKIVVCLRQTDKSFVELNVLLYVVYHELAHLMTKSVGHTPEFWKNFRFLLEEAVLIGVYTRTDYAKNPQPYCGIEITHAVY